MCQTDQRVLDKRRREEAAAAAKPTEFKPGDRVRIARGPTEEERDAAWKGGYPWAPEMEIGRASCRERVFRAV